MHIAAVHQFTGKKILGDKCERQLIKKRYSPFVSKAIPRIITTRTCWLSRLEMLYKLPFLLLVAMAVNAKSCTLVLNPIDLMNLN
jgi:hypothetical protein